MPRLYSNENFPPPAVEELRRLGCDVTGHAFRKIALLAALALSGCSTTRDDQDFYERGWLWPRSIDTPDRPVTAGEKRDAAAEAAHPSRDW